MGVVILTGNQGNQKALCNKIAKVADVSAIVISGNVPMKDPPIKKRILSYYQRVCNRLFGSYFTQAWFQMLERYDEEFPSFPDVPIVNVRNINQQETLDVLRADAPTLTVVSGTNIVGKSIIELSPKIINLHTGISPYVKGGPNCTNWCLAKNWLHLIGNTVMWLDRGIDTGKIISTERTELTGAESLYELHLKVMEHAHDLYVRAIVKVLEGREVPSVPQNSIGEGHLFKTKDWTPKEMRRAKRNFRQNYSRFFSDTTEADQSSSELRLIELEMSAQ